MGADGLPRDAEPPGHISDVADFAIPRDHLIYFRRAELTGRSGSRRALSRSLGLRRLQRKLGRRAAVAMFAIGVQQVHRKHSAASLTGCDAVLRVPHSECISPPTMGDSSRAVSRNTCTIGLRVSERLHSTTVAGSMSSIGT